MSAPMVISRFVRRARAAVTLLALARGLLRALPVVAAGLLLIGGMDHWLALPSFLRKLIWLSGLAGAAGLAASGFWPRRIFSVKEMSKNLHQVQGGNRARLKPLRPDDMRIAFEFLTHRGVSGVSEELKARYLSEVAAQLEAASPLACFPGWRWRKAATAAAGLLFVCGSLWAFFPAQFPLSSRILFPFASVDLERYVRVEPGNGQVSWGGVAEISVSLLTRSVDRPVLYVKTEDVWLPVEPEREIRGTGTYAFRNVVQPLHYRVRWKNEWGRKYVITPAQPLRLIRFDLRLRPPDYVKKEAARQSAPEIKGLAGTMVELEAFANQALEEGRLVFSDGRERAVVCSGEKITVQFSLDKSGTYGFSLKTKEGLLSPALDSYPIHVVEDQLPSVSLLSPDADLVVGEKEKVPLTYDAKDDFGVAEVFLVWEGRDGKAHRRRIAAFNPAPEGAIATYEWDMGKPGFPSGEVIVYYVEVVDGNSVTGPGKAASAKHVIEIASFEKQHAVLDRALEEWRGKALDLLAEVNTLKAKAELEGADLPKLAAEFNQTAENSQNLERALDRLVALMEQDPLADYGVWLEHQAMRESLSAMNQSVVKNAQAALQTQNKPAALSNLEEMASELERMSALSENLSKTQHARDVVEAGRDLEEAGEDLVAKLEEKGGKMDPALVKEVNDLIKEAQKVLQEMAQALQNTPQDLLEDFVNQEALKNLNLGKSQDLLSQIQEAMKNGNAQEALRLAKEFLKQARQMSQRLEEANESYLDSHSLGELEKQMAEKAEKLNRVVSSQRGLLAETQGLESKRLAAQLKAQEALLEDLARRQKKVVAKVRDILSKGKPEELLPLLNNVLPAMQDVAREFEQKRVENSEAWLMAIIAQLAAAEVESRGDELGWILKEEKEILAKLKEPLDSSQGFSADDKKKFEDLKERQADLGRQTQALRQEIQALSRKTASLGVPLTQALAEAAAEMTRASEELGRHRSQSAQTHEERALSHLLQGQSELEGAQGAMSEMASQQGPGSGGGGGRMIQVVPRGGGQRGTQMGKVKLPSAEDYRPPKEFREELLESLREKYPKVYEDIIHKYYKRLSE